MSDYFADSRVLSVKEILYSPTACETTHNTTVGRVTIDTIAAGKKDSLENYKTTASQSRASLPSPQASHSSDDMMILAKAFVAAYTAMNQGILDEAQDYSQLQLLNETQSQSVLISTQKTLDKESQAFKAGEAAAKYEKHAAKTEKILGKVMFWGGLALMGLMFASAFFTGGATAPLMDEAAGGMMELSSMTDTLGEGSSSSLEMNSMSSVTEDPDVDMTDTNSEGSPNYMSATEQFSSTNTTQFDETIEETEQTSQDAAKSDAANTKSETTWGKKIGMALLKMAVGAGFASPMLMKGIYGINIHNKLEKVADAQEAVGKAMNVLQQNNMMFQFMQQLIQREGNVIQEESNDASEVIDTFGDITNTYKAITYGLANAV